MPRKRFTSEQIIGKLREAEVALAKGRAVPLVCKQIGVTEQTYYRWRKEYGGLKVDQAKKLRELEKENTRLKKLVANMALDNDILYSPSKDNPRPSSARFSFAIAVAPIPCKAATSSSDFLDSFSNVSSFAPASARLAGAARVYADDIMLSIKMFQYSFRPQIPTIT